MERRFRDGEAIGDYTCTCVFHVEYLRLQTHTVGISNNNFFFPAKMVARKRLHITYQYIASVVLYQIPLCLFVFCITYSLNRTIEHCVLRSHWQDVRYFTCKWYGFAKTYSQHKVKSILQISHVGMQHTQ